MRSIAVLLVLADHLLEMHGHIYNISFHPFDWYCGRLGVLLFFVHTSLVLMLSMQRSGLSGKELFLNFYIRRAFRIYPLSILCVFIVASSGLPPVPWIGEQHDWSGGTILANIFLVQNLTYSMSVLAPLWSLPLEVQMYVMLPAIFLLLQRFSTGYCVAGLWVLAVLGALIQPVVIGRLNVAQFAPCFVAGVIAYARSMRPARTVLHWGLWPLFLTLVLVGYVGVESVDTEVHHPAWLGWLMCLVIGGCMVNFADMPRGVLSRASQLIARYSYGIYLFQMFALWVGFVLCAGKQFWFQWVIFAALITALPVVSYHMLEKPLIQLGVRLASRCQQRILSSHTL